MACLGNPFHDFSEILQGQALLEDKAQGQIERLGALHGKVINGSMDGKASYVSAGEKMGSTTWLSVVIATLPPFSDTTALSSNSRRKGLSRIGRKSFPPTRQRLLLHSRDQARCALNAYFASNSIPIVEWEKIFLPRQAFSGVRLYPVRGLSMAHQTSGVKTPGRD